MLWLVRWLRGSFVGVRDTRLDAKNSYQWEAQNWWPPMSVHDILKSAILSRRCVMLRGEGLRRKLCPHALGYKDKRPKLLAYQYSGDSASGLAASGGWRSFFLDDIQWAEVTEGAWRSGDDYLVKLETSFDAIECQARPLRRAPK